MRKSVLLGVCLITCLSGPKCQTDHIKQYSPQEPNHPVYLSKSREFEIRAEKAGEEARKRQILGMPDYTHIEPLLEEARGSLSFTEKIINSSGVDSLQLRYIASVINKDFPIAKRSICEGIRKLPEFKNRGEEAIREEISYCLEAQYKPLQI